MPWGFTALYIAAGSPHIKTYILTTWSKAHSPTAKNVILPFKAVGE
jgi:hypothetical protein